MKRKGMQIFLAMLLAAVLLIKPLPVSAENTYTVRLADASGSSVVTAEPGQQVTLLLSIENNPGIIGVGVKLQYPAGISLIQRENVAPQGGFWIDSPSLATQPYLLWWNYALGIDGKLVYANGDLARLTFQVAADAAKGDYTITLTAPSDINTTAATDGNGKIQTNTNRPVTGIALVNCTIRVGGGTAPEPTPDVTQPKPSTAPTTAPTQPVKTPETTQPSVAVETTQPAVSTEATTEATQPDTTGNTAAPTDERSDTAEGLDETSEKGKRNPVGLEDIPVGKRILFALCALLLIGGILFFVLHKKKDEPLD